MSIRTAVAQCLAAVTCPAPRPSGTNLSDYDLNPGSRIDGVRGKLRMAAVLVPIVERDAGVTVLLTQRAKHLSHHAGQISFPGGRVEPHDQGAIDTALRETEEEIGLDRARVDIIGCLDVYETVTGFLITPVIGFVREGFTLTINQQEVSEAFEVPLDFVLDPANHERHSREFKGARRYYYAMPYQHRYIWGATAGMLVNLSKRLSANP